MKDKKNSDHYTATKKLVRRIDPAHRSGKRPRVSSAAFERGIKKGKKEEYLSVNCQDLESLSQIVKAYASKANSQVFYIRHKIEKINAVAQAIKAGIISYDRKEKHFVFSGKPAYTHQPLEESYSHSGIMFVAGLTDLEEKELAIELTKNIKPEKSR